MINSSSLALISSVLWMQLRPFPAFGGIQKAPHKLRFGKLVTAFIVLSDAIHRALRGGQLKPVEKCVEELCVQVNPQDEHKWSAGADGQDWVALSCASTPAWHQNVWCLFQELIHLKT